MLYLLIRPENTIQNIEVTGTTIKSIKLLRMTVSEFAEISILPIYLTHVFTRKHKGASHLKTKFNQMKL